MAANEKCRGWICRKDQECTAELRGRCTAKECQIFRACHGGHHKSNSHQTTAKVPKTVINAVLRTASKISPINYTKTALGSVSGQKSMNKPTTTLIERPLWLKYLEQQAGVEIIKKWQKNAEQGKNYTVNKVDYFNSTAKYHLISLLSPYSFVTLYDCVLRQRYGLVVNAN